MNRRQALGISVASTVLLLSGQTLEASAAGHADQGPPFRTVSDAHAANLMLMGHDAVAIFPRTKLWSATPRSRPSTWE